MPSLRFAGLILPIVIFLGSARGFLFLVSYPLVTLLLWVILAYRNDWYVTSRRKQGIYRGQLWNRPLLETPPPTARPPLWWLSSSCYMEPSSWIMSIAIRTLYSVNENLILGCV